MKKTITMMLSIFLSANVLFAQNLITDPGFENDPTTYTVVEGGKNVLRRVANIKDETTQTAAPTSGAVDISAGGIWVKKATNTGYIKSIIIDTDRNAGTYCANLQVQANGVASAWYNATTQQKIIGGLNNSKRYVASVYAKIDPTAGNVLPELWFFVANGGNINNYTIKATWVDGGASWAKYSVTFDLPTWLGTTAGGGGDFASAWTGIGIKKVNNPADYAGILLDDFSFEEDTTTGLTNTYLKGNPIVASREMISSSLSGKLIVYNVAGSIVLSKIIQSGENVNLSSGMYFLQLATKDGIYNQKVVL